MMSCHKTSDVKSKTMVAFLAFTDLGWAFHFSRLTFHDDVLGDRAAHR